MKRILIILLLIPTVLFGQSESMELITNDYCKRIQNLDWASLTPQQMYSQIDIAVSQLKSDYQDDIYEIMNNYGDTNLNNIEKRFNTELSIAIIYKCDRYISLTRTFLKKCPKENTTLVLIANRIDSFMKGITDKPYSKQLRLADNEIVIYTSDIEDTIKKDYPEGLFDPKLPADLGPFLLHKSDFYYKAYLANQYITMNK